MDDTFSIVEKLVKNNNTSKKSIQTITDVIRTLHLHIKECDEHIKLLELKYDVDKIANNKKINTLQNNIKIVSGLVFLQSFIFMWNNYLG